MSNTINQTTYAVGKVNNVPIVYIKDENRNVPIKPICDALGIDSEGQNQKIKRHKILGSVACMIKATGSDGKKYDMSCLPYKYIFGWLFSIDITRVSPEAAEAVERYQTECYDILYRHFVLYKHFVEERQAKIDILLDKREIAKDNFKEARNILADIERDIKQVRTVTFHDWQDLQRVQPLPLVFEE